MYVSNLFYAEHKTCWL